MKMLGLLGLVALIAADAQAQERGSERSPEAARQSQGKNQVWNLLARKYDRNQDGKVTPEEYPREDSKFKSFDRNGDGVLSAKDFENGGRRGNRQGGNRQRGNREEMMKRMAISILIVPADANKDGAISEKEWKAHIAGLTTKNGDVDMEKLTKSMPQRGRRGSRRGGQQGQDEKRMAERRQRWLTSLFDGDRDGEIAVAELSTWFAKVDKNQDGTLGKEELPARRPSRQAGQRRQAGPEAPKAGQVAPDFELAWLADKNKTVKLSSFQGSKPVALIFGSYT